MISVKCFDFFRSRSGILTREMVGILFALGSFLRSLATNPPKCPASVCMRISTSWPLVGCEERAVVLFFLHKHAPALFLFTLPTSAVLTLSSAAHFTTPPIKRTHSDVRRCCCVYWKRADGCFFFFWTGFTDGSVVLTKGDITRDRHSKTLTLHEGTSPVTGLAFRQVAKVTHLFVATLEKVHVSLLVSGRKTNPVHGFPL